MKCKQLYKYLILMAAVVPANAKGAPADDQKIVAALDTQYQAAVKINDAAVMDRILADDFILVDGDGRTSTKTDLLSEARSQRVIYEHQDETEQTVRVWGDTAVVTAKLWGKGTESGKQFDWTLWFSDTYVRTPRGWRYVFGMASLPLPNTAIAQAADLAAIEKLHQLDTDATLNQDPKELLDIWTDDAVRFLDAGSLPDVGKKAIAATNEKFHAQNPGFKVLSYSAKYKDLQIYGGIACEWGEHQTRYRLSADAPPTDWHGDALAVMKRQSDGSWKTVVGIGNP